MVQDGFKDKGEWRAQENREKRRRSKRKQATSYTGTSSSSSHEGIIGKTRRDTKLASQKREHESRGTRTRRRTNGGSLSSRGSATGMQCGLCAVLAGLFRRAMCIAGSRRGSGESCYQELTTEMLQTEGHCTQIQQTQQTLQTQRRTCEETNLATTDSPFNAGSRSDPVSRSGSLGSLHKIRESVQQERPTTRVTLDSASQNAVFVRISEDASLPSSGASPSPSPTASASFPAEPESASEALRRLSDTDRSLIENLDIGRCRSRHTGRFLTMHKRRRKRLITRSLNQEPGLLDDIFHGQVQCVLQRSGNWRFNAFTLETVTGGRSLPVLCVHLFQWYGLIQRFNLDVVRVWKLFALIEEGYHSTNPYHNSIHATDVTQAMHCFLQEEKIKRHLSSLEIMASLIAAVTHDLDHPGVNQPFLVATSNHLATLYENTSVLENHHWRSAIGCLLESGVSEQLPPQVRPELERHISSLILATDITRQQEFLTCFKNYLDKNTLDMERPENRHFILQISLKCADISNPCRPWDISRKWSYKVCEEFFRQGDYERQLNLPVTPLCDRQSISIPKIQAGFFEFVVTPLYEEWHRFLGDGLSVSLMLHLRANQKRWEALIAQEAAEETKTEMSDLEQVQNSSTSDDEEIMGTRQDSESADLLLPDISGLRRIRYDRRPSLPAPFGPQQANRRHSVPLSVAKPSLLLLPSAAESRAHSRQCFTFDRYFDDLSSLSLLSSKSSVYETAGNMSSSGERPVSAENLLPETSIASITSSVEASRLCTVLQPENLKFASQTKHLTRQQTFPPLQPYVRIRYMSTTAEMSKCRTETLMEADDSPCSSDPSPSIEKSGSGQRCGTSSETDCDSTSRNHRKHTDYSATRLSRDHNAADDRGSRRRESIFSDLTRQSLDTWSFAGDIPRRHSVQTVRLEDSTNLLGFKHRHKRPSSAQEAYPTQMLYASLTGGSGTGQRSNGSEILGSDSRPDSRTDSELPTSSYDESALSKNLSVTGRCPAVSEITEKANESESRRHSTPATEAKTPGENGGRRFTAIPVASELPTQKVFFIGSPPESPPRVESISSSSDSGSEPRRSVGDSSSEGVSIGSKRDSNSSRQKSSKMPKLSDDARMKENVDPRGPEDINKGSISSARRTSQGWARRRGSAPVALLARLDDCPIAAVTVQPRIDRHSSRRGSVPADITGHQGGGSFRAALSPRGENVPLPRRASLPQEAAISNLLGNILLPTDERENCPVNNNNNNNNNNSGSGGGGHTGSNNNGGSRVIEGVAVTGGMPSPRRGSVPADISELRRDLFGRSSGNGKARNRKKTLRRRSSGGPEMFAGGNVDDNDNGKWPGWKRDLSKRESIPEPSVKRRGSLPVEMVSIFHPGSAAAARRSSLWRL